MDEREEEIELVIVEMYPLPKSGEHLIIRGFGAKVLSTLYPNVYILPDFAQHPYYVNIQDVVRAKPKKKKLPFTQDDFID
jgi:hypothetical protein